jgi:hypothetical protein
MHEKLNRFCPCPEWSKNISTGLRRWYINITITILDIIYHPVFYLEHRKMNNVPNCDSYKTYFASKQ